jgi:hypothetical protein
MPDNEDTRESEIMQDKIDAEIREATRYKGSLSPLTDAGMDPNEE